MSTWHLVPDDHSDFRWQTSGFDLPKPYHATPSHLCPASLPSMSQLLHEGCPKILETRDDHRFAASPVFRTGSGAFLRPKHSSISEALAVLGDDSTTDNQLERQGDGFGCANSLFQTASGKKVNTSSAALARAKLLLGQDEVSPHSTLQVFESKRQDENYACNEFSNLKKRRDSINSAGNINVASCIENWSSLGPGIPSNGLHKEDAANHVQPEMLTTTSPAVETPPIKFHTAGGRSISVSADALKRARSLLGDPELGNCLEERDTSDTFFPIFKDRDLNVDYVNQESHMNSFLGQKECEGIKEDPKGLFSRVQKSPGRNHLSGTSWDGGSEYNKLHSTNFFLEKPSYEKPPVQVMLGPSDNRVSRIKNFENSSGEALLPTTSNTVGTDHANGKQGTSDLRRLSGRKNHVSPFKRPRSSKFTNPLNNGIPMAPSGLSNGVSQVSCCKKRVSTCYPATVSRVYIQDFFKTPQKPPLNMYLPEQIRWMNPCNAEKYVFCGDTNLYSIGIEAFHGMLAQSGASLQHASKEWVANHYKWIVWKLACYERFSLNKYNIKFLSVSNVLEELKYRYEREVNHGHRSAIKKILEGDASPSSVLILCISTISSNNKFEIADESERGSTIELTDGWYSINAQLDVVLSDYLACGKLFVGQKLRIWGSSLCGWDQPVSPLEAPRTIKLMLHANGTYRACWADRLGFSRESYKPLAFACIKTNGGPVPRTLVGVTRIYPVLYRERVGNEVCIVRSEKAEAEAIRLHNQRCSNIIEGVMSDFQKGNLGFCYATDHDSEEGAKILKMLESAFEPEMLMAEMSREQLASVTNYQAKLESRRQLDIEKSIKKAIDDAGLGARQVTPFVRVRVSGLSYEGRQKFIGPKEGLITIWNPTEKQRLELAEGQAYAMSGLTPLHSNSSTLFLHARGSALNLHPLTSSERECFLPFFNPRESVLLSKLGEVPLSSEFDAAVLVLYVGKEYVASHQKRQWVFVTDGSAHELQENGGEVPLLAINFCSSYTSDDSALSQINSNLVGSIVGFCNLIKKPRDETNGLWVAEATENTTYHLNHDYNHSHLSHAFASAQKWAGRSPKIVEKLRQKVLFVVGDNEG